MALGSMGQTRSRRFAKTRISHHRSPRVRATLRIVSNIGLIVGQCILLFASRDIGLIVIICSGWLSVPFFLKEKMWDVLILIAFMQVINFTGLFLR